MQRSLLACLLTISFSGCVPRVGDTRTTDLDGDGIVDADDACMADPEDADGFEDEDGCAEPGGGSAELAQSADSSPTIATDPRTKERRMRRSKAKPLRETEAEASITPYRDAASGAAIDTQERAWVVYGIGKTWIGSGSAKGKLFKGELSKAEFAADGSWVVMVGAKSFVVVDVKSGKELRRLPFASGTEGSPETKLARTQGSDALLYYDGCQIFRADATKNTNPAAVSAKLCGDPRASIDGRHWFVHRQNENAVTVHKLDMQGGSPELVLGGTSDDGGLSKILLSPDGTHLCYSRNKDGSEFSCRNNQRGEEIMVWSDATDTRAVFSKSGKLVFGAGPLRSERDLVIADLDTLELRKLGTLSGKEKWLSAIDDSVFVASGGQRLLIFDLESGEQISVPLDKGEWEGFAGIPGENREFILGKERRATRDLYRIRVR